MTAYCISKSFINHMYILLIKWIHYLWGIRVASANTVKVQFTKKRTAFLNTPFSRKMGKYGSMGNNCFAVGCALEF